MTFTPVRANNMRAPSRPATITVTVEDIPGTNDVRITVKEDRPNLFVEHGHPGTVRPMKQTPREVIEQFTRELREPLPPRVPWWAFWR